MPHHPERSTTPEPGSGGYAYLATPHDFRFAIDDAVHEATNGHPARVLAAAQSYGRDAKVFATHAGLLDADMARLYAAIAASCARRWMEWGGVNDSRASSGGLIDSGGAPVRAGQSVGMGTPVRPATSSVVDAKHDGGGGDVRGEIPSPSSPARGFVSGTSRTSREAEALQAAPASPFSRDGIPPVGAEIQYRLRNCRLWFHGTVKTHLPPDDFVVTRRGDGTSMWLKVGVHDWRPA